MKPEETLTDKDEIFYEFSLIPLHFSPHSPFVPPHDSTIAVGSEIYFIGGLTANSSSVRILDCRSHTWHDAPSMTVARKNTKAVLLEHEIYVMGGCRINRSDNTFEVFDIKTQTWSVLPSPIPDHNELRSYIARGKCCPRKAFRSGSENGIHLRAEKWYMGSCSLVGEESRYIHVNCVIENVMYGYSYAGCLMWYDYEGRKWKDIKGLGKLREYLKSGWNGPRIVNYGGKLVFMWRHTFDQYCKNRKTEIWCVKIALEKRVGGEIWGKIEWLNTVFTVPGWDFCLNCVAVVSI